MERWIGKVGLVTGAGTGIGRAISEKLVENGLKVVGLGRKIEPLEELAKAWSTKKGKFIPIQGDVSKEEDVVKSFNWIKNNVGPVSFLVNNAGLIRMGLLTESPTKDWVDTYNTNVIGLSIATREAIKQMKENKINGQIININSTAGRKTIGMPGFNNYSATKFAVTALTETVRMELVNQGSKIKITSLSPGTVKTDIVTDPQMKEALQKMPRLNPTEIANAAVFILSTPEEVQISELTIQPVGEA